MKKILSSLLSKTLALAMIFSLTLSGCSGSLFLPIVEEYDEKNATVPATEISIDFGALYTETSDGIFYVYSNSANGEIDLEITASASSQNWTEYTTWEGDAVYDRPDEPTYQSIEFDEDDRASLTYTTSDNYEDSYEVNILLRNGEGEESDIATAMVVLDRTAPDYSLRLNGSTESSSTAATDIVLEFYGESDNDFYQMKIWRNDETSTEKSYVTYKDTNDVKIDSSQNTSYSFFTLVTDKAGNVSQETETPAVTYNTTIPSFQFYINSSTDSAETTQSQSITIITTNVSLPSSEPVYIAIWNNDDSPSFENKSTDSFTHSLPSDNGDHTVYVQIRQGSSNYSSVMPREIRYDSVSPTITGFTIDGSISPEPTNDSTPVFAISASDALASDADMEVKIWTGSEPDDSEYEPLASFSQPVIPTDGEYTYNAKVRDNSGNESTTHSCPITYDATAPDVTSFLCLDGSLTNSQTVEFRLEVSDNLTEVTAYKIWDGDTEPDDSEYVPWTTADGDFSYTLPSDAGDHSVKIQVRDKAGNESDIDDDSTYVITYDPNAPTLSFEINANDEKTNNDEVTLTVTTSSDVTGIKIWEGSTEPTDYSEYTGSSISYTLTTFSDGSYSTVNMKVEDEAGNESTEASDTILCDETVGAPTISIDQGTTTSTTLINLTLSADADVDEMKIWHGELTAEPTDYEAYDAAPDYDLTGAVSGTDYTIYLKVKDDAGNESDPTAAQASVTYNSNAPEVELTVNGGVHASTASSLALDISTTAPSGTTVTEMKIWITPNETEPSTWEDLDSTATRTLSTEGTYEVNIKVRNNADVESGTVAVEYIYDESEPEITSASMTVNGNSDSFYTNSTSLTLAFSDITDNIEVYEMKIWTGDLTPEPADTEYVTYSASTPHTLSTTNDTYGVHALFRDEAGNESDVLTWSGVTLDTVNPTVNMTADVSSPTNSDTATITFNGSDTSPLEIKYWAGTDEEPEYSSYISTWTDSLSARGEGEHAYYVRLMDAAGNTVTGDVLYISYDVTVPTFSFVINSDDDKTNTKNVTLSLDSTHSDISGYKIWETTEPADYTTYVGSDISYELTSYADGESSTVNMRVQDTAGNESDSTSDSIIFDESINVPSITIDQGSITAQNTIDLTLSADGDVTDMKVWHGDLGNEPTEFSTYTDTVTNYELTGAVSGTEYTLFLMVRDDAGNVSNPSDAQASISYNSDTPEVTLEVNDGDYASGTATITLDLTTTAPSGTTIDGMKIWVTPEESEPADWSTDILTEDTHVLTTEGTYYVNAKVKNDLGTESGTVVQEYIYDATAPVTITATISVNGSTDAFHTNSDTVTLAFNNVTDNIGVNEMKIWSGDTEPSEASYEPYSSASSMSLDSGEGVYNIHSRFRDEAGNESDVVDAAEVTLDTTPPAMNLTSDISSPTNAGSVTITINGSDAATMEIQCWVDSETEPDYATYTETWTDDLTARSEGQHTYHVRLRDEAGNTAHNTYSLTYDVTAPLDLTVEIDGDPITNILDVALSLSSSTAHTIAYWTDSSTRPVDTTFEDFSTTKTFSLPDSDGYYDIYAAVRDEAGNESAPVNVSVTLDRVAPELYTLKIADTYNGSSTTTTTDGIIYVSPITDEGSLMKIWYQPSGETAIEPVGDDDIYITFATNYVIDLELTGSYQVHCLVQDEAGNIMSTIGSSAVITY